MNFPSDTPNAPSDDQLDRFLLGDATPEEAAVVAHELTRRPLLKRAFDEMQQRAFEARDADAVWVRVQARVQQRVAKAPPRPPERSTSWTRRVSIVGGIAALVAVVVYAGRLTSNDGMPSESQILVHREYATQTRQRATIGLPDGTEATLAPGTQIRYTLNTTGQRNIELAGEAFFVAAHDPKSPLTIRTNKVNVQVLGTEFGVRRYGGDTVTQVAVVSGKVAALPGAKHTPIILTPGTMGEITDSTATAMVAGNLAALTAWTRGRLLFEETPVPEVLETLGRWYDVRFEVVDSMVLKQHVTADLLVGEPSEMMAILGEVLGVVPVRRGKVVTLRPRPLVRRTEGHTAPTKRSTLPIHLEVGK